MPKKSLVIALCSAFLLFNPFDFDFELIDEFIPKEKKMADQGLYVTSYVVQTPSFFNRIKNQALECGLNTLVIDSKRFLEKPLLKLLKEHKLTAQTRVAPNQWFSKLTKELHKQGFIVSARIVVFKDDHLVIARPDLGVNKSGGGLYRDLKGGRWADPYSDEVRLYNELIAEVAALSGADEVQFDYIRFPAEAGSNLAIYPFEKQGQSKVDTINIFLKGVRKRIEKYNTSIAVDIFGVIAWQTANDIESLGQDIKKMAPYIDVLCPMFYPSHFHAGYDGFANPGSHPYYFINMGIKKTKQILSNEAVVIVPWLQGFNLRSPNFGSNYILEQIRAAKDAGVDRYLVWNARNDYWATVSALKKRY